MRFLALLFLLLSGALFSTEYAPWFGRSLEIETRTSALFQYYRFIATPIRPNKLPSFGQFYTFSTALAYDRISGEGEITFASTETRRSDFAFDHVKLTGRYLLLDDVVGDLFSLTAGASFAAADRNAVNDISSFHHGTLEFEGHLAFGKEKSCRKFWTSRWWGLFAYGIANEGKSWLRGRLTWEKNFCDIHRYQLFLHGLLGLGTEDIDLCQPFEGYGLIQHRSLDLGGRYTFFWEKCSGGSLSLEYAFRPYALNFPQNTQRFMLRLYYPFGL